MYVFSLLSPSFSPCARGGLRELNVLIVYDLLFFLEFQAAVSNEQVANALEFPTFWVFTSSEVEYIAYSVLAAGGYFLVAPVSHF